MRSVLPRHRLQRSNRSNRDRQMQRNMLLLLRQLPASGPSATGSLGPTVTCTI
ncbi:hypothetical protein CORC01_10969 [Colletotrichum orchidophilum]|uniref:Uncharacterized protein n=1 Tax=Colletotrichum orchidophilum TaxID=1209926 RepID=A0A1G4AXG6_9PEZI|nr:uncharacterized protein CORC01_10969 [Colletotrichum orchidophilum]OHE93742.1 hypothetical protein CORC01_10969 [Colletotrichum orchidophilum]